MDQKTYVQFFRSILNQAKGELKPKEYIKLTDKIRKDLPPVPRIYVGPKMCSDCGEVHDRSQHYKDKSRPDGLSPRCMDCDKVKVIKYLQKKERDYHTAQVHKRQTPHNNSGGMGGDGPDNETGYALSA